MASSLAAFLNVGQYNHDIQQFKTPQCVIDVYIHVCYKPLIHVKRREINYQLC